MPARTGPQGHRGTAQLTLYLFFPNLPCLSLFPDLFLSFSRLPLSLFLSLSLSLSFTFLTFLFLSVLLSRYISSVSYYHACSFSRWVMCYLSETSNSFFMNLSICTLANTRERKPMWWKEVKRKGQNARCVLGLHITSVHIQEQR